MWLVLNEDFNQLAVIALRQRVRAHGLVVIGAVRQSPDVDHLADELLISHLVGSFHLIVILERVIALTTPTSSSSGSSSSGSSSSR